MKSACWLALTGVLVGSNATYGQDREPLSALLTEAQKIIQTCVPRSMRGELRLT